MENKKKRYLLLGVIGAVLLGILIFIGVKILPKVQIGKEISDLLQPLITEENQSMHLDISADFANELVDFNSDIYLVKDEETKYVVMDQYDFPIYIVDNVLYLENGHAFLIAEEVQSQSAEKVVYEDLFLQIAAAYEMFDITCVKTDLETRYSVTVTGEQVQELLQLAVPTGLDSKGQEQELLSYIKNLNVQMTARNDKLDRIEMAGSADIGDTAVQVNIVISEFNVLDAGEYVIPDVIKDAVKTVDKDSLFSLTKDLYRLLVAFEQFSKQETSNGTVTLRANCGIINFKQTYDLKDFENLGNAGNTGDADNTDSDLVDTESIEKLPEMIGFLCMEGEITSTEMDNGYEYKLTLDKTSMQKIAEMVVPELVNYVVTMKEGTVVVMLENDSISSITIEIDGSIKVFFSEVPAEVGVTFQY